MKKLVTYQRPKTVIVSVDSSGDIDSAGYATISNTGSLGTFASATVPALSSATYDIDISIDGTNHKLAVALLNTDAWSGICTKIQTALRTATSKLETVAIVSGKIKVTSVTVGSTSSVLIAAGTTGSGGGDILAAIDAIGATYVVSLDTPVNGTEGSLVIPIDSNTKDLGTSGYATVSSLTNTFIGATVPALNGTYYLQVSVDGGAYNSLTLSISSSDSFSAIATKIQTALRSATSSTETCAIDSGKIKISSVTVGYGSKIRIIDGNSSGLLAAISAVSGYECTVDVPYDGVNGRTQDFVVLSLSAKTSANVTYTGLKWSYSKATGNLTVADNGSTTSLAVGDQIVIQGVSCNLSNLA